MATLSYTPVETIEIRNATLSDFGVRVLVRREDLNHPAVSGNKWWKLKYNLEEATKLGMKSILTFGGAYSNHIYASAAAANEWGLRSIGIIRGEETLPLNPVLSFAIKKGMRLMYISRDDYREKTTDVFIRKLKEQFGDFYLLPEGGTNELAMKGCEELGKKILRENEFDLICLPVGTGGTLSGIVAGFENKKIIIGFSVLKGEFLKTDVNEMLRHYSPKVFDNWRIETDYHFGGYAKSTPELLKFISDQKEHGIPLDKVYTSKMLYGIYDLVRKGTIKGPCKVLVLHTGGLHSSE